MLLTKLMGWITILYFLWMLFCFLFPNFTDKLVDKHKWYEPDEIMFFGGIFIISIWIIKLMYAVLTI